jgi:hypothetical protein
LFIPGQMALMELVPSGAATLARDDALREFVATHEVCSEVAPHLDLWDHRRVETALDLSLFAVRPFAAGSAEENFRTWIRLRELALRVIPPEASYVIRPFDVAYHLRREAGWRPEVELVIEIRPPDEGLGLELVDDRTRRTTAEILEALDRFGVARGAWRESRRTTP